MGALCLSLEVALSGLTWREGEGSAQPPLVTRGAVAGAWELRSQTGLF